MKTPRPSPHSFILTRVSGRPIATPMNLSQPCLRGKRTGLTASRSICRAEVRQVPGYRGQPIVNNEDDHYAFDQAENNYKQSIEDYVSWGYFDFRRTGSRAEREGLAEEADIKIGYQSVPVDWSISHPRKEAFFNYTKEISGY